MSDLSTKLCECGCGQPTPIATRTQTARGQIKGQPLRFLRSHGGGRTFSSLEEAFNASRPIGLPDECWEWQGVRNRAGYGKVPYQSVKYYAHRVAWTLENGIEIPAGMKVCHTCDNPPCCNPSHLFLGTDKENSDDKIVKERHARGKLNGTAKLTEAMVISMRDLFKRGIHYKEIAERFGVSRSRAHAIVTYTAWKHVP